MLNNFNVKESIFPIDAINKTGFLADLYNCSWGFVDHQVRSINRSLYYRYIYYYDYQVQEIVSQIRYNVTNEWIEKYNIKRLESDDDKLINKNVKEEREKKRLNKRLNQERSAHHQTNNFF